MVRLVPTRFQPASAVAIGEDRNANTPLASRFSGVSVICDQGVLYTDRDRQPSHESKNEWRCSLEDTFPQVVGKEDRECLVVDRWSSISTMAMLRQGDFEHTEFNPHVCMFRMKTQNITTLVSRPSGISTSSSVEEWSPETYGISW